MATTMKLHWSPKSPYVRNVMICNHEFGWRALVPRLADDWFASVQERPSFQSTEPIDG